MVEEADQRLANRRLGCLTDKPGSKIVQCRESFCRARGNWREMAYAAVQPNSKFRWLRSPATSFV
jgi:hypothetical protein